jgi:hypothetical protein
MASTTTNGVILEVPYCIVRNIRNSRPWTISVVGRDTRQYAYNQQQLRSFPATPAAGKHDIFVYKGDVITFNIPAPCNDATAVGWELWIVDFSAAGAEWKLAEIAFDQVWQKNIIVTIMAIDPTNGATTYAIRRT